MYSDTTQCLPMSSRAKNISLYETHNNDDRSQEVLIAPTPTPLHIQLFPHHLCLTLDRFYDSWLQILTLYMALL